jgi:pimeloyl-ACP methyl ester carboxylesterase
MPALAEAGYRAIAPDSRGFGWTEHPGDEDFSHEAFVEDVVALCGELGLERVRYVGHDWGCWFGFLLALERPALLERAVLMSAPHPWPEMGFDLQSLLRIAKFSYQIPIALPAPTGPFKPALFSLGLQGGRRDRFSDEEVEAYMAPLRQPSQQRASTLLYRGTLLRAMPSVARGSHRDGRITVPVRYLFGEQDPIFDEGLVSGLDEHAGSSETEVIPGAAHFLPEEVPDLVNDRVLSFLG